MDNTIALYAYPNNTNNSSYENKPLDKNNKILTPILLPFPPAKRITDTLLSLTTTEP